MAHFARCFYAIHLNVQTVNRRAAGAWAKWVTFFVWAGWSGQSGSLFLFGRIVGCFLPQPCKPRQKTAMAVFWVACGAFGLRGVGRARVLNALHKK